MNPKTKILFFHILDLIKMLNKKTNCKISVTTVQ